MELIHSKCGRKVEISILRGGKCEKCNRRWWPFICWFALDLRPISASEVKERKQKSILESKIAAAERGERRKYGKWAENTPGATMLPSILPNWKRRYRIASVLAVISIISAIVWFAMIK